MSPPSCLRQIHRKGRRRGALDVATEKRGAVAAVAALYEVYETCLSFFLGAGVDSFEKNF
jgi:hypothetical protein